MDSCQIFNFLFGTKKATTELSKCFSNLTSQRKSRSRSKNEPHNNDNESTQSTAKLTTKNEKRSKSCSASEHPEETPPSPFKQLQMKLTGLAPAFYSKHNQQAVAVDSKRGLSCDAKCGTYRATLVKLVDETEDKTSTSDSYDLVTNADLVEADFTSFRRVNCEKDSPMTIVENPLTFEDERIQVLKRQKKNFQIMQSDEYSTPEYSISVHATKHQDGHSTTFSSDISLNKNDNNKELDQNTNDTAIFKKVIMYGDKNIDLESEQNQIVASSAQVYELVSQYGQSKAKLRRVSSVSTDGEVKNYSIEGDHTDVALKNDITDDKFIEEKKADDKRSDYVRNLVSSFENATLDNEKREVNPYGFNKPVTIVKPLPPPPPPMHVIRSLHGRKSSQCLSFQLRLDKPNKIQDLFRDETFLRNHFFAKLEPLDRCTAAQVCRSWRNILYSNQEYWKDLINVIDCRQLRREHLVECILNTIQSAKLRHQQQKSIEFSKDRCGQDEPSQQNKYCSIDSYFNFDLNQDDIWKIQELCNRFTTNHPRIHSQSSKQHMIILDSNDQTNSNNCIANSKSSSIPSQISSTLSSVSISSLLSPLSESSRIDSIKEKLYTSLDDRGFDALCLFGASYNDVEELIYKLPASTHQRIIVARLNNCSFNDRGLELLTSTFSNIEELELSGCNEITNALELKDLTNLKRLIITDCINIADGIVQNLMHISHQLTDLTLQAYHLTDAFLEYLCLNSDTSRLTRLELPNCKEITNQSLATIAKYLDQLEVLSISGSTKISDDGVEVLAEQARQLRCLDLSWCTRITDASLECIACDLGDTLVDLILDRNIHITDIGIGYLSTMSRLRLLHIRWCPRITDVGLESLIGLRTLKYLSLAGIHQITARSLLCLVETNMEEIELTNCPAVNNDLIMFLSSQMPKCNIIF